LPLRVVRALQRAQVSKHGDLLLSPRNIRGLGFVDEVDGERDNLSPELSSTNLSLWVYYIRFSSICQPLFILYSFGIGY
jgi:hypothetical protein